MHALGADLSHKLIGADVACYEILGCPAKVVMAYFQLLGSSVALYTHLLIIYTYSLMVQVLAQILR